MVVTFSNITVINNRQPKIFGLLIVSLFLLSGIGYGQFELTAKAVTDTIVRNLDRENSVLAKTLQHDTLMDGNGEEDVIDEILITLHIQYIGSYEMSVIIRDEIAYLPANEIFNLLKIRSITSADLDSVQAFFTYPTITYIIDRSLNQISTADKVYKLNPSDIIVTENGLYLKSDYFGKVFGLNCDFSFRSLSVSLTTKIELPAFREMQQELLRKNISQLKGEKKVDTTIRPGFSWFRLGTADWGILSSQDTRNGDNLRANLGIGGALVGGEANLFLNYDNNRTFRMADQIYYWRRVDNDFAPLRQVTAGKLFTQSTASIFDHVTGVQFTNTPTTYRRSFGTYTLSDKTEPEWTVELYINNVLVNYTKADASGFFTFEVPMVYGNSIVKLRYYGPWGEERMREQNVTVPFNFIPAGQFEYTVTAGVVSDDQKSKYSRVNANYGMSKRITVGGGIEYLSSVASRKSMPFMNASLRLGSNAMLSGEHTYGVRSRGLLNFRAFSRLQFNLSYLKYAKDQTAVWTNQLDEKKAVITMPFRGKKLSAISRLTVTEINYSKTNKLLNTELMLSANFSKINANLTTNAAKNSNSKQLVYSNLSLTFRLPEGIRFTPQVQYEYNEKAISLIRGEAEKSIFRHGFLNLTYEQFRNKEYGISVGFRYNFSFALTSVYARQSKQSTLTSQAARGSFFYNGRTNQLGTTNQNSVGRGGLIVIPFLDMNCNGKRDSNEPKAPGLQLRISGGRIQHNENDTTIRIVGLEGYTSYFMELDKNSFDNIGWQMQKTSMKIAVQPNVFKIIEVPVAVLGEVSGNVYLKDGKGMKGLGRVIVNIYNQSSAVVARVLSEEDGYFSYIGLVPGSYTVAIDQQQLLKLQMRSSPVLSCKIQTSDEGDIVEGLQFVLTK